MVKRMQYVSDVKHVCVCMKIINKTLNHAHQYKTIIGRKRLKLIIQIWVNQNNMRRQQFQSRIN